MPKTRRVLHRILFGTAALAVTVMLVNVGCSSSKKKKTDSKPPQRDGSSLSQVLPKYNDNGPSLSADGGKVVFVSGRESTDAALIQKAFKADWPTGEAPGVPARVTTDDLGSEKYAVLSGDGAWVAMVAVKAGAVSLHLQDYAGASGAVTATDDGAFKLAPSFSPDSKLLAWISEDASGFGTVKVVAIGAGSAADLAEPQAIVDSENNAVTLVWVPTGDATYALAIGARTANKGALSYTVRRFATVADAATAEATALVSDILPVDGVEPAATTGKVFVPKRVLSYEGITSERVGDIEVTAESPAPKYVVDSQALQVDVASNAASSLVAAAGTQIVSLSAGATATFASMRYFYGCQTGGEGRAAGIVVAPYDGSAASILVPKLTEVTPVEGQPDSLSFEVAVGFCDRLKTEGVPADGAYRLDDRVAEVVVSSGSTPEKFRAAYVTTFSHRFETDCRLRSGDQEVLVVDGDGETRKIYDLSANRSDLTDVEGASCTL